MQDAAPGLEGTDSSERLRVIWFSRDRSTLLDDALSLKKRRPSWSVEPCANATTAQVELAGGEYDFVLLDCAEHSLLESSKLFELARTEKLTEGAVALHAARDERDWLRIGLMQMDDFVDKNSTLFVPELCTRLERLSRRARASAHRRFGGVEIDLITQMIQADDFTVHLSGHGWRIVYCLALAGGGCVSPQELCRFVGIQPSPSQANLQTEIWRLRSKLGKARDLIESVRGKGYRLRHTSCEQ